MTVETRGKPISAEALDVLVTATITGNVLVLGSGQLDRKLYVEVNEVLSRLDGKWVAKLKGHVFPEDPSEKLTYILSTGSMPPKNPDAFFPTPANLIDLMFYLHDDLPGYLKTAAPPRFLEPSAGEGAIAVRLRHACEAAVAGQAALPKPRKLDYYLDCVEVSPERASKLRNQALVTHELDFLKFAPAYKYGRVYMNPPFALAGSPLAYIDHILHAYELLEPGGKLVAIAPSGFTFRTDKKSVAFRTQVDDCGYWDSNKEDAFKASGTMVNTVTLVMDK
jgi:hypothetical protein